MKIFKRNSKLLIPVSRAVHGLKSKKLLLHLKGEHVFAVVLPVPRGHPEFAVVHVWSDYLLESSLPIFTLLGNKQDRHTDKSMLILLGEAKI